MLIILGPCCAPSGQSPSSRPWTAQTATRDLALAEGALHILAGGEIPLDGGSSTYLNDHSRVNVELAARGPGDIGRVPMPLRV